MSYYLLFPFLTSLLQPGPGPPNLLKLQRVTPEVSPSLLNYMALRYMKQE